MSTFDLDDLADDMPVLPGARVRFWLGAADVSRAANDWPTTAERLERLGDKLEWEALEPGKAARLVVATAIAGIRADAPDIVRSVIQRGAAVGLRGVDDISPLMHVLEDLGGPLDCPLALADALANALPTRPWGYYLRAHFRERERRDRGRPPTRRVALEFEEAAQLFEIDSAPVSAAWCRVRAAHAWFTQRRETDRARALLREAPAKGFTLRQSVWRALALISSPHWLDHVRGLDALDDLVDAAADGDVRHEDVEELASAIPAALELLRGTLSETELERLRTLTADLRRVPRIDVEVAAAVIAKVELEALLREQRDRPLSDWSADADAPPGTDAEAVEGLIRAWNGDLPTSRPANDVVAAITDFLAAMQSDEDSDLTEATSVLRKACESGSDLRPVALVVARVVERGIPDACKLDMTAILAHWADRGPAPTFGWWVAGYHVQRAGFPQAGAACVKRAIADDERTQDKMRAAALGRAVHWAVTEAPDSELTWWLELAEPGTSTV